MNRSLPISAAAPGVPPTMKVFSPFLLLLALVATPALALSEDRSPADDEAADETEDDDGVVQSGKSPFGAARSALKPSIAPVDEARIELEGEQRDVQAEKAAGEPAVPPPMTGPRSNAVAQATKKGDEEEEEGAEAEGDSGLVEPGQRKVVAQAPKSTKLHVEYEDVEIKDVIKDFSERWGLNVLVDPKISGKVTIYSPVPVERDLAFKIFLAALDSQGYTTVVEGRDSRGQPYLLRILDGKSAKTEPIEVYRGSTPNSANLITRIVQLENVNVDEVSKVISKMISSNGDLTTYNPSNTLIITDSGNNIRRLLDLIQELDIRAPKQKLEIVKIQFAEAARVVEIIREIYGEDASGTEGAVQNNTAATSRAARARARRNQRNNTAAAATEAASTTSVGSEPSFIGKMIADERTNSIIVLATEKAIEDIRELIAEIDYEAVPDNSGIHVVYLSHAKAEEMSTTLNSLIQQSNQRVAQNTRTTTAGARGNTRDAQGSGVNAGAAGDLGGNFAGEVRITHDVPTNSLVITASSDDFRRIDRVIQALDIQRRQVFVETVIMEVSDTARKDTGVSWHAGRPGDASNPAAVNVVAGRGTESLNLASALLDGSLLGGAGLGIFGNAISVPLPGVDGGFEIPTFGIVLRALQDDQSTNVLSAPNILTLDNEEASIEVGETVPFPTGGFLGGLTGAAGAAGGFAGSIPSVSFTREDVGIILRITPQVNESDWVTLDVYQEISEVKEGSTGNTLASGGPTTTKRSAETHVAVKSNQTIVIGGLMQEVETESESKVPILGDIPLIGALFRQKLKTKRKTNLLIFLTPHVIDDAEDLQEIYRIKMMQREEFMRRFYGKTREQQAKELNELLRFSMNLPDQPSVYRDQDPRPRMIDLDSGDERPVSPEVNQLLESAEDGEVLFTPSGEYMKTVEDGDIVIEGEGEVEVEVEQDEDGTEVEIESDSDGGEGE